MINVPAEVDEITSATKSFSYSRLYTDIFFLYITQYLSSALLNKLLQFSHRFFSFLSQKPTHLSPQAGIMNKSRKDIHISQCQFFRVYNYELEDMIMQAQGFIEREKTVRPLVTGESVEMAH